MAPIRHGDTHRISHHISLVALAFAALALAGCGGGTAERAEVPLRQATSQVQASYIAATYTATRVPDSLGWQFSFASFGHVMNTTGQVAFEVFDQNTGRYRVRFFDGTTTQVITPADWDVVAVLGTSDDGRVVGVADISGVKHAWAWKSGSMKVFDGAPMSAPGGMNNTGKIALHVGALGNLLPHVYTTSTNASVTNSLLSASATLFMPMNDAGWVAGSLWVGWGQDYRPYLWNGGQGAADVQWITPPVNAAEATYPTAVNESLDVVGHWAPAGGPARCFIWRPGDAVARDLGGSGETNVAGLNNQGVVIAADYRYTEYPHGFVRYPTSDGTGRIVQLGTLGGPFSTPRAINDGGVVVGATAGPDGVTAPFAWTESEGMMDLNTRIANAQALGLRVASALAITSDGTILAHDWDSSLVLLRPGVPSTNPPLVGALLADDPVAAGVAINISAQFTDTDTADTHTAVLAWGDGMQSQAQITEGDGIGTAAGSHVFAAAGIYTVALTVTDSTGRSAASSRQVVVYDASAGFATGAGWFTSPPGAYKADPIVAGPARFAFVARYTPGKTVPDGSALFQFQAGGFQLRSTAYDWLVIAGTRAQIKGSGLVNGEQGYQFMMTGIDGALPATSATDRVRVKVWRRDQATQADVIVYDNQLDATHEGTTQEGTSLIDGNILVHR